MSSSRFVRTAIVVLLVLALVPLAVDAQEQQQKKKKKKKKKSSDDAVVVEVVPMFEANELEDLVAAVDAAREGGATIAGDAVFMEGLAYEKLQRTGEARATYAQLAARSEDDVWHWVGASAEKLIAGDTAAALEAAARAVEMAPRNELAHYQHGLVRVKRAEYAPAAEAFTRMLEIDGDFAYGHYYAGMSYHQVRNLMAAGNHLRRFLELAPEAPEKLAVQSILATISG